MGPRRFKPLFLVLVGLLLSGTVHALERGDVLSEKMGQPYTGDLDGMLERGYIRMLVPYSLTGFYIDKGRMRGVVAELAHEFEVFLNKHLGLKRNEAIKVVMIPMERNKIIAAIREGRGDIAAASLTITDSRREMIDFANPIIKDISEFIVTRDEVANFSDYTDFARTVVHVRRASSHFESVRALNEGKLADSPVPIVEIDDSLEDEELLEMINADLIPAMVIDSHILSFWRKVFPNLNVHENLPIREGGEVSWGMRKNSPELMALVNAYMAIAAKGTSVGNTIYRRYFDGEKWLKNIQSVEYTEPLVNLRSLFEKYGEQYRIDWLILAALAFQESKFDQSAKSQAGAVGIMQIKPSTAKDPNIGIADVHNLENNIHAGTKYLRFIADRYFEDADIEESDRVFMALASYNAGPNGIARVRKNAKEPDEWFGNLEHDVAASIGMEPVYYVSNVFRYYLTLKGIVEKRQKANAAKSDQ